MRELLARIGEVLAQTKAQGARIDGLLGEIKRLLARIAELEAKAGAPPKTPANSSVPPSKGRKANRPEAGARRKPRHKSHAGVARRLAETPDHVRDVFAARCAGCCVAVSEAAQTHVRSAYDRIDLPPLKPIVTRVVLHACTCRSCGNRVAVSAPAVMPACTRSASPIASATRTTPSTLATEWYVTDRRRGVGEGRLRKSASISPLRRTCPGSAGSAIGS